MTWTRTILDIKDGNGTIQPVIAYTDGTNYSFAHPLLDNTGAIISPAVYTGSVILTANPTISSNAYTAGMSVGGLITLSGATRINGGSGMIQTVQISVKTDLSQPFDVAFFDTEPTSTITDNTLFNPNNLTDLPYCCSVAHCTDIVSFDTPQIFQATNLGLNYQLSASNTNLYAVMIMRGVGQTFASTTAVQLSVRAFQD
jgi:hypothetical protein